MIDHVYSPFSDLYRECVRAKVGNKRWNVGDPFLMDTCVVDGQLNEN